MNQKAKLAIQKIHSLKNKKGKIVAVESKTGRWFMGESPLEVIKMGDLEFPDGIYYIVKVGYKVAGVLKMSILL